LLGFFSSNWQHQRIEQELQNARTLSDKRREADHRRALKNNRKNWRRERIPPRQRSNRRKNRHCSRCLESIPLKIAAKVDKVDEDYFSTEIPCRTP
jgi:hypothetical protein